MKNSIDLLIVDIDDTFIYHRTVAIANKILLKLVFSLFGKSIKDDNNIFTTKKSFLLIIRVIMLNFFRFRPKTKIIKKLILLIKTAIYLHFLNILRDINNKFFSIISSEKIMRIWINTVISIKINQKDYQLSENAINNNLNKQVLNIYNSIKKTNPKLRTVAISQHFNVNNDPIKKILDIDLLYSNKFTTDKNGIINEYKLNIKNKEDKKIIAEDTIKKFNSKNIGIFIDDHDDLSLLKLKNLKFVLYKKRLRKFIDNKQIKTLCFK